MSKRLLRILFVCCVACLFPGCNAANEAADVAPDAAPEAEAVPVEVYRPDAQREVLPSDRIYFTLTDHDWYAHGQPLLHDGRAFMPAGMPIAASVTEMTKAGDYEGVEFYTRNNADEAVVYVPVFQGYWQPFRADSTAPVTTVAAPNER